MRCFDDQIVADSHLHVSGAGKDEVARTDLGTGDRNSVAYLLISSAVQVNSRPRVGPLGQPRTIEPVGPGAPQTYGLPNRESAARTAIPARVLAGGKRSPAR